MINHKEDCLSINGKQSVDVEEGIIEFKNYSRKLPVLFKIYECNLQNFECNLQNAEIYEGSYTKKYDHVPCSFANKVVCIEDKFSKPIVIYRGKNAAYEIIKAIFKEYRYCKKVIKKHFDKNFIMREEEEHLFQPSNCCHICEQLINNEDEKVRDYCHVTGKFRGAAHCSCNMNYQSTTKIPVIFHNLRGYDSHLIFSDLNQFDVKISVIPNGLEKYMAFFLGKNIVLVKEFGLEYLEILKHKGTYPYEYTDKC